MADIPPATLRRLNRGEIECVSLVECLAVDFASIARHSLPGISPGALRRLRDAAEMGWLGRTKLAGEILQADMGLAALPVLSAHASDQVRGWGAMMVAAAP